MVTKKTFLCEDCKHEFPIEKQVIYARNTALIFTHKVCSSCYEKQPLRTMEFGGGTKIKISESGKVSKQRILLITLFAIIILMGVILALSKGML